MVEVKKINVVLAQGHDMWAVYVDGKLKDYGDGGVESISSVLVFCPGVEVDSDVDEEWFEKVAQEFPKKYEDVEIA